MSALNMSEHIKFVCCCLTTDGAGPASYLIFVTVGAGVVFKFFMSQFNKWCCDACKVW